MVAITGTVQNILGGNVENFILTAKPRQPYFNGNVLVPIDGVSFPASTGGLLSFSLPETESIQQLVAFSASYTGGGIYREILFHPVLIPDVSNLNLGDLLLPLTE